jgi:hypothetical protein
VSDPAAVMLGMTLRGLCGNSISDDVMNFLAGHRAAARQAAIQRGFAARARARVEADYEAALQASSAIALAWTIQQDMV